MRFESKWEHFRTPAGVLYRPLVSAYIGRVENGHAHRFLIDSGADLSMVPRRAWTCEGAAWEDGEKRTFYGIAVKEECAVVGRIHWTRLIFPQAAFWIEIPICYVDSDVSFVLGREGFFDHFRIAFDRAKRKTIFQTKQV